ncbi:MAG: TRCF domain-containing protein, partial [Nannocystaceae bacterium]
TATPVPRTLHLSLLGIREISMISTPPMDRLAVRTYLTRSSDVVLQQGIRRELGRGGQIFVVMPRVLGIEAQARRIRELAPDARVQVAHGQMPAKLLEATMLEFVEHKIDILVCTTIIESGLDIPRANTMFIERAELFGMAQLHQLRGRIGRGRLRAHCYLLVNSLEGLTEEAKRRLEGVVRHGQLGAGFNVATRDLEIRGAGDILGKRQSGAIQSVGFDAYARLLEEAVAELRGAPISSREDTELSVDVPAFLPDDYIVDTGQRLDVYRRLARARTADEVDEVMSELRDRYGELPHEAAYYGMLMQCRARARAIGATSMELRGARLTLRWPAGGPGIARGIREYALNEPGRIRVQGEDLLRAALSADDGNTRGLLEECRGLLHNLPTS